MNIRKDFKMNRAEIRLSDQQMRIFNGRGWVNPQQNTMTGFQEPNFATFHAYYRFRFDLKDVETGVTIVDDVPALWEQYVKDGSGTDPLGANFREGFAKLFVTQDEIWQPGQYERTGSFNKALGEKAIPTNIAINTHQVVSHIEDKTIMKVSITNRGKTDKVFHLIPQHSNIIDNSGEMTIIDMENVKVNNNVYLKMGSTVKEKSSEAYVLNIKSGKTETYYFGFNFGTDESKLTTTPNKLETQMNEMIENTYSRMEWFISKLPKFTSPVPRLQKLYYQSMVTMNECRWLRDDFVVNPFWSVGSWLFTISWDTQFSSEALGLLNPKSLLEASWLPFTHGKMRQTWVGWNKTPHSGDGYGIFYVQEPVSVMHVLTRYLKYTKDFDCLKEVRDGKTLLEWLKVWADTYYTYINDDNLIDVGPDTEVLVEIRTDGYDHIVPNVNVIAAEYLYQLSILCKKMNDADSGKFEKTARDIIKAVETELWDEENQWLSNKYADGSKENIYVYHLFDSLGSSLLSKEIKYGLMSHIKESEFLGKYGFFSLSKQDTVHHDRIDADWGGGGQFAGMPGRIATNTFKLGAAFTGYEILKKVSRWTDVYPYQPQNARAEEPFADLSSMAIQVSSGASIEAIILGMFGVDMDNETITINPSFHEDQRGAKLEDIIIGGHNLSIYMYKDKYEVFEKDKMLAECFYGKKFKINRQD